MMTLKRVSSFKKKRKEKEYLLAGNYVLMENLLLILIYIYIERENMRKTLFLQSLSSHTSYE